MEVFAHSAQLRPFAAVTSISDDWGRNERGRNVQKQSQSVLPSSLEALLKDGRYALANTLE